MKVQFNAFILNTLDMMKFKNIARNSCEAKLVTLPIMLIRNVMVVEQVPRTLVCVPSVTLLIVSEC